MSSDKTFYKLSEGPNGPAASTKNQVLLPLKALSQPGVSLAA